MGKQKEVYEYTAKLDRVVDGDTVDAELDLGFNIIYKERIRLMGIDTPESRTRNKVEKKLGLKSKARLKELISENKGNIILKTSKEGKGKFGRILGEVFCDGVNVTLLEERNKLPDTGCLLIFFSVPPVTN